MSCKIVYAPERGELTGLVRMPSTPWDQPDTWWLDCLVTYETEPPRTEGLVLPVVIVDPAVDVIQEAGRILATWCVVAAVVCHVRPPMPAETIMAIQETNVRLGQARRRVTLALALLRTAMAKAHDERVRRRSIGLTAPARPELARAVPANPKGRQLEMAIR